MVCHCTDSEADQWRETGDFLLFALEMIAKQPEYFLVNDTMKWAETFTSLSILIKYGWIYRHITNGCTFPVCHEHRSYSKCKKYCF